MAGVLLATVPAFAAWLTLTPAQGLPFAKVSGVCEDALGRYWFGGLLGGLSRYDGTAWTSFSVDAIRSGIRAVLKDRSGNIWFATDQLGVARFDGTNWVSFQGQFTSNRARTLYEDRDGRVWVGTGGFGDQSSVARYDSVANVWRTVLTSTSAFLGILEDRSGILWFGTEGSGVLRYDPETGTTSTFSTSNVPIGFLSNEVRGIAQGRDGVLWFATRRGLTRFDGAAWSVLTDADGLPGNDCTAVLADRRGEIWVGTDGYGAARFDGYRWTRYSTSQGLASNKVLTIYQDGSGYLWFGTEGGGVSRYDDERWTTYTQATTVNGLRNNSVAAVEVDGDENLWFATLGTGVSRYDRASWFPYMASNGLASNQVRVIRAVSGGDIWFGTAGSGISRLRPSSGDWVPCTAADSLAGSDVPAIIEDHAGILWLGTRGGGVGRYDPRTDAWRRLTMTDGLPSNSVPALVADRANRIWFGTAESGVIRFDGAAWVRHTAATTDSGLPSDAVTCLLEDSFGRIWAGTEGHGLGRYDSGTGRWTRFTRSSTGGVLPSDGIEAMLEDRRGTVWVATEGGVGRYESENWRFSAPGDSLREKVVSGLAEDGSGALWFTTLGFGARSYEPDQVALPITVFRSVPPRLSPIRSVIVSASILFASARGHEFSFRVDDTPWSPWSADSTWSTSSVADGPHTLEARSRNAAGNLDPTSVQTAFEVDATPPLPVVNQPTVGQVLRGAVAVLGTVQDARLREFRVRARPSGTTTWDSPAVLHLSPYPAPVVNDTLAVWDTRGAGEGHYEVLVSALDSLGLEGVGFISSVVVDNYAPWADETAPAIVSATGGAAIFAANGAVRLYFPPRAFDRDVVVQIDSLQSSEAPDSLEGASRVLPGYDISWGPELMRKTATMELSLVGSSSIGALAVYVSRAGGPWTRTGGTVDARTERISLSLREPGRYAVYRDQGGSPASVRLSPISLTPRVFSPRGSYADRQVGIGFTLGRPTSVTVKVYSRAGRIIREVAAGLALGAGSNLVWWDGRNQDGATVKDGLYFVAVEALGEVQTKAIAVVK